MAVARFPFTFASGTKMPDFQVGYSTQGAAAEADGSNVLVFPSFFAGTKESLTAFGLVGDGLLADTALYHVVTIDAIGAGESSNPDSRPGSFPDVTIGDMVRSQHTLLTEVLGYPSCLCFLGYSLSGAMAYEWMVRYPDFFLGYVPIVGTPLTGGDSRVGIKTQLDALLAASPPNNGRTVADRIDIPFPWVNNPSFVLAAAIQEKSVLVYDSFASSSRAQVDAAVATRAASAQNIGFGPKSWGVQINAALTHDVRLANNDATLADAAARVTADVLTLVSDRDNWNDPAVPTQFMVDVGANGSTRVMTGSAGHLNYFVSPGVRTAENAAVAAFITGLGA